MVPKHVHIAGIDDSKKVSAAQREAAYELLTSHPEVVWAAEVVEAERVDDINILQATYEAMVGATAALPQQADFVLVDGNSVPKV